MDEKCVVFNCYFLKIIYWIFIVAELIGSYNKNIFDQRTVSFTLGEGSEQDICEGVEKALEKFKKNEKSLIVIKPKYAFKETGHEKFNIPPNATIDYVLELKNFEKVFIFTYVSYLIFNIMNI